MKREIKFRIWNGTEMVYDITVGKFGTFYVNPGYKGDGLNQNDSASLTPFTTKYHEDTPVMQFTGLMDKNGKEIYEGDIIDAWVSRWPDKKTRGIVVWNNHCGAFQLQYEGAFGNNPTDFIHRWHFFEVIENIYQNKEFSNGN